MKTSLIRWLAVMVLALCPQGWCVCALAGGDADSQRDAQVDSQGCCERCPSSQHEQSQNGDEPCGQCDGTFQPRASFNEVKPAAVSLFAFPPLAGFAVDDVNGSFHWPARAPLVAVLSPQTLLQLRCALVI